MTIWKYPLEVTGMQHVLVQRGARLLSVQVQVTTPCLWALVDPKAPKESRAIITLGTGNPAPNVLGAFLGTYQMHNGALVFHVFEG